MARPLASDAEITAALAALPGWTRDGHELRATYRFATFAAAVAFTQRVADAAERANHHPEWTVRYRSVDVRTTTHDSGGITAADLDLARAVHAAVAGDAPRTWVPPGHFYSPLTDPAEVERDAARLFAPGLRELAAVDRRLPQQFELALELARYYG